MKLNRAALVNSHLVVASFFLPFGLMFLVTGALYTVGIKGSYTTRIQTITLAEPLRPDVDALVAVATAALDREGVTPPSGEASVRKVGGAFQLEWSGVARDLNLKAGAGELEAVLEIKETTPLRRLVQLHKAKGNTFAKALSVAWAAGLLVMFASGLSLAWASAKHRKLAMMAGGAGLTAFVLYVLLG